MKPDVKVFTREYPCTKVDIWNCFSSPRDFVRVPVVKAHSLIVLNVPRGMERMGRLERVAMRGVEYYQLTDIGKKWLLRGIKNYVHNHPSDIGSIYNYPPFNSTP